MSDLRSSFENEILKENPAATPEEIEAEWNIFIEEYDEWNFGQVQKLATRGTNDSRTEIEKAGERNIN